MSALPAHTPFASNGPPPTRERWPFDCVMPSSNSIVRVAPTPAGIGGSFTANCCCSFMPPPTVLRTGAKTVVRSSPIKIGIETSEPPAAAASLSAETDHSPVTVTDFLSFTKWNKCVCDRLNLYLQFTPKV